MNPHVHEASIRDVPWLLLLAFAFGCLGHLCAWMTGSTAIWNWRNDAGQD